MGWFDWLTGKRDVTTTGTVQPSPFPQMGPARDLGGPDSVWVMVEGQSGMVSVMDRDAYEYMSGLAQGPDPAQRDLDDLLPRVRHVRVLAGGLFRGKPLNNECLAVVSDAVGLEAFRGCWRIVEDASTFTHCCCLGGPTLELVGDEGSLATIGLQHGHSIRWKKWKHDARLTDGE